ncbi:hypothetical protein [Glycomyces sp. NPDC047010]|uniref:hypothetical protein n=1 Tax=Glycomyces sp. NPDC047010 TaxID=3155023 RepID=UPI0033F395B2
MSDRNFDPDSTRETARVDVPVLADAYERLEELVTGAGAYLDSSGASKEMAEAFTPYHLLLRNAVVESRQNYEGLGPALERIAEDDELAEAEIVEAMNTLADGTESTFAADGYTPMAEGQHGDSLEAAPSEFDGQLGSGSAAREEGTAR